MALYSLHIGEVQRSKGQNAVASSAYNSRSKLTYKFYDKETKGQGEITWNYSDKEGLAYAKIHAPDHAPDWTKDRESLWNRAEEMEKRDDSQTARKFMVALQKEFTLEQNTALIEDIAKELVELGMVVDVCIHDDDPNNPHAHLLATTRELKEDRYGNINFSPMKQREWGSRAFYCSVREMVADKINEHFAKNGFDIRVSHLSYKDQGIDLKPTKHIGPAMNITNSELVKNNLAILEENYQKVIEKPSRILDKLTINSPVFTKEQIATELDKVLSHQFMSGQIVEIEGESALEESMHEKGGKAENSENIDPQENKKFGMDLKDILPAKDLEDINKEYSAKFMELHNKIMNSLELSMVIESDLKGRTLYTTTKRLEMEERYLSTIEALHSKNSHALNIDSVDSQAPTLKEVIIDAHSKFKSDLKQSIEKTFGINVSFLGEEGGMGEMSLEQRRAVMEILNGNNISILEGIPGSGKTVSMREIVKQCRRAGKKVIGVAPSSAAALVLEKETGIDAKNATLWRKEWMKAKGDKFELILRGDYYKEDKYQDISRDPNSKDEGGFAPILNYMLKGDTTKTVLTKNHVMIIDEASMMELSNMDYMLSEASRVGAKVILVGDNNQLHGVGWLGAYKKAIDICGTSRLEESRRQQNLLHREATMLLGQYKVREALKIYLHDKSIEIDKGELNCRSRLVNEYIDSYLKSAKVLENDDIAAHRTQVISTYTNDAAAKLNKEVRQQLKDAGIVKGKEYDINVGDKKILLARGDQIVFTRNYNYLGTRGIYNGEVGTVLSMTKPDTLGNSFIATLVSKADGSKEAVIIDTKKFLEYGDARLLDYGYAVTAHKLQGSSVDYNFLFFEKGMGYEALNVLLTRHRQQLRCFIDYNLLEEVSYESVADVSDKEDLLRASLRYEVNTEDKHLNALVKLASKRVNASFAGDYKDMGLTKEDKQLKSYIETVHESIEIIREISTWQSIELRKTGSKPALWDHEKWGDFLIARGERNEKAKDLIENYPDFKDRIIQLGMNYETIKKHAEVRKTFVDENHTILHEQEHYKDLVYAIEEVNLAAARKAYKKLKGEIADNYASISELKDREAYLDEKYDELRFAIEGERNFREKLIPNYLFRIYKNSPDAVLSKFNSMVENLGDLDQALKKVSKKPSLLGDLKGVGISTLVGIGKGRKDAIANTETLEHQLHSYVRSEKLEAEYIAELGSTGTLKELREIREKIDAKSTLLPNALDDKFLDSFHIDVMSGSTARGKDKILALNDFRSTDLFESIRLGMHRPSEDKKQNQEMHSDIDATKTTEEYQSDTAAYQKHHAVRGISQSQDQATDKSVEQTKKTPNSYNRIEWDDVNAKLSPHIYESIFRDYASAINPDGSIQKKNANSISCGSLNMDLKTGLWHRFSSGEGGNIYDFVAVGIGKGRKEALEILADRVGVRKSEFDYSHAVRSNQVAGQTEPNATKAQVPRDDWIPHKNIPVDAPEFNVKHDLAYLSKKGISINNIYEYRSRDGNLLGYTIRTIEPRTDNETGEIRQIKQVMPVTYCFNEARGKSRWQLRGFLDETNHKPIYNAHLLEEYPNKPVLIVEGEKAADYASKILPEYNVISWMGGTGGVKKVNWSQLKGKEVLIWPDNDKPGLSAAKYIANNLDEVHGSYGNAKIVDTTSLNLPEKWDLADKIPSHLTIDAIRDTLAFTRQEKFSVSKTLSTFRSKLECVGQEREVIDILLSRGKIDLDLNVSSKEIYKDIIISSSIVKRIDLSKSDDVVSNIMDFQENYELYRKNYEHDNKPPKTADKKEMDEYSKQRDVQILAQIQLEKNSSSKDKSQKEEIVKAFKEGMNMTKTKDIEMLTSDAAKHKLSAFDEELRNASKISEAISIIERRESYLASLYGKEITGDKDLLSRVEASYENNKKNHIIELDKKVRYAAGFGVKDDKELISSLKGLKTDKITDFTSALQKDINKHYVDNKLEEFHKDKSISKTPEKLFKVLEKENDYLSGLHSNMKENSYSKELQDRITKAHVAVEQDTFSKMHKSMEYALKHNITHKDQMLKDMHGDTDLHSVEKSLTNKCLNHNIKIMQSHLRDLTNDKMVHFDGKWFENGHEYLTHWKQNYDHHMLPMKNLNHDIKQFEHQMSKNHEIGGPRL